LRRSAWGNGFATEAAEAALRWAYETLGWETAISCIDPNNVGSQGVAKRLGATLEESGVQVCFFTADIWRHLPPKQYLERAA
ncbi:MAG: GNAT family N-acetyltransferase, partial [Pseudomonadota bacterium]